MNIDYTLCNTPEKLTTALTTLQDAQILFLDCEGERLGVRGGKLSLISIGVPTHHQQLRVYLIDALALGGSGLRPIWSLLSSPDVRKVVFDGRMDQSAFYYSYNRVTMDNVVDLQLADVKSRWAFRGEKAKQRRARLVPYLDYGEVNGNKLLYQDMHKLAGLQQVVREHGVVLQDHQNRMKMKAHFDHKNWMKRPLGKKSLRYAANDITLIHAVCLDFTTKGYIGEDLPAQSLRYTRMWIAGNQPRVNDEYKMHALLPLDILFAAEGEQRKRCKGCERELSKGCFSNKAWGGGESRRRCLVCRAIGMRVESD
ncbi:ribonuclease H-like domain-containing protein [Roridomyces roridus]|uniref:Ribonuclease H-like domain-containing protein n=1 Tax=Roridomyces roridus TaxID=1738132 RepID=A0AAD7C1B5_9AGAR|nr:ribonuclease H-like domain-containing protein [Roridomyces roridus]